MNEPGYESQTARVMRVLRPGVWMSSRELAREIGSGTISSRVRDARKSGAVIKVERRGRVNGYRRVA